MTALLGVLIALAVMGIGLYLIWQIVGPTWRKAVTQTDEELSVPVLNPTTGLKSDVTDRMPPPRLSWNWAAALSGPFWYLYHGLWAHFCVLATAAFLSGGLLLPFVWMYSALKANEDFWEFRKARWSAY
jgi:hypothetical protein